MHFLAALYYQKNEEYRNLNQSAENWSKKFLKLIEPYSNGGIMSHKSFRN